MLSTPVAVRRLAATAPLLLLAYGLLRLVDGLDGQHGPGLPWDLGHTLFLLGIVMFALLALGLRPLVSAGTARQRLVANLATGAAVFGAGCFAWVIVGDLFQDFSDAAPLPGLLRVVGPLAFELGLLTLLTMLAAVARPRRLPVWSPVCVLVGFVLLAADLDMLPISSLLVLAGLVPLARGTEA